MARLNDRKRAYTIDYPPAILFSETQEDILWTSKEIVVAKDIQDMRVNMTAAEYHGVVTTLKLFTLYELAAGTDYWLGRVMRRFPRPDIQRMAAVFGYVELNVHAPFYNQINEALMLNTESFYTDYVNNPILKDRMEFIEEAVTSKEDLVSLGTFAMVEGGILYSAFAFLKHFQNQGKNKLMNVVRGINFSVRDENLHCEGGKWLFKELLRERLAEGTVDVERVKTELDKAAHELINHELQIVEMIFEKGDIEGIDKEDMKTFIVERVLGILHDLIGEPPITSTSQISDWFYKDINMPKIHDFFTGIGSEYNRDWDESKLEWKRYDDL